MGDAAQTEHRATGGKDTAQNTREKPQEPERMDEKMMRSSSIRYKRLNEGLELFLAHEGTSAG